MRTMTRFAPSWRASIATALIGSYNVANLLAVIGGLRALGVPLGTAAMACAAWPDC